MNPILTLVVAIVCSLGTLGAGKGRLASHGVESSPAAAQTNSLYAVDIVGLRAGMTPRRVAQEAAANGWTEDTYSLQTLEDIIRQNTDRAQVGFNISKPKKGDVQVISATRKHGSFASTAKYERMKRRISWQRR